MIVLINSHGVIIILVSVMNNNIQRDASGWMLINIFFLIRSRIYLVYLFFCNNLITGSRYKSQTATYHINKKYLLIII